MIDSVLKGTGNSRFLKSAVPAGTSWADALAMLQAGTFPIDFNGINAEGFQQVGTPLNKANLLKDATAAQIGLPPSTTPDGMFQALGNTGDLHVWRKTVVTTEPVPAGYTLGKKTGTYLVRGPISGGMGDTTRLTFSVMDSISVSDSGELIPGAATEYSVYPGYVGGDSSISGKFISISKIGSDLSLVDAQLNVIYYIPPDGYLLDSSTDYYRFVSVVDLQTVTGYAKTPAGTTTTYPVSTNPNAYQEGDDAKPAGYTLGDVVTGEFLMSDRSNSTGVYVGTTLSANSDGTVNIVDYSVYNISNTSSGLTQARNTKGKYIKYQANNGDFNAGDVWFIPSDASIEYVTNGIATNKRQPVTGYAAIPAGTTIEYLGKLGDKARVQVMSYVGTGTYGKDNPCSITADFLMKVVFYLGYLSGTSFHDPNYNNDTQTEVLVNMPTVYKSNRGFSKRNGTRYGKISPDRKTLYWYGTNSDDQLNTSGSTYYFLALA